MEHNQLILSAKDVNIQFNLRGKVLHAIRGIDLDLYQGEVLAIVGESGSGKSVFTKSFMGLLDANGSITSGTIDYYGMADGKPLRLSDLRTEKDWLRVRGREIAMFMQDPMTSLNPLKTIGAQIMEAVALHQGLKGAAAKEKTLEYLRDVGIADPEVRFSQYPHEFSGGMRQRVVIAIAVACNPQILICDEPTTALDVTIEAQILQILKDLKTQYNTAILMITHNFGLVAEVADRIAVMYAGNIVEHGNVFDVFAAPSRALEAKRTNGTAALQKLADKLGDALDSIVSDLDTLETALTSCHEDILAAMSRLRTSVDAAETLVNDRSWPLPKYREMLFIY